MIKINRPPCPNPAALRSNYKDPENKGALKDASCGKCMYCESKVTHIDFGDVEHIKPKFKYPELEFAWSNLGFVCSKCNNSKGKKYDETTPYINPYEEDPDDYVVAFGSVLWPYQQNERGQLTIDDIQLNRTDLIERRKERLASITKYIGAWQGTRNEFLKRIALQELKDECCEDKEYSLFVRAFLKLHDII
ncbi:HNH endonuclease family protein [Candidatus Magnetoovum chiemensis]|nr:HNH endonuclease family protein [Candidatus Magnetoovum chiemensis]